MGVRSTAILFGTWIRPLLMLCGAGFVSMLGLAGYLNNQGPAYFILSVGGTALHVIWQFLTVDLEVSASCWSELYILRDFSNLADTLLRSREFQPQRSTRLDRLGWPLC